MLEVLKTRSQIRIARQAMIESGRSVMESRLAKLFRRFGWSRSLPVGDYIKSWDVARTLDFIAERLARDAVILDLGAYCSEVPVALAEMRYTAVHGVDLNPAVLTMPRADIVRYAVGNFLNTPYADASFDAVTAISVIEHGYDAERLFAELGRLLKKGGYFIASFDYWPQKIDTGETTFFDLSWLIFSEADVQELLRVASRHGLQPAGPLQSAADERAVECGGFNYTFAWLVLQKA